MQNKQNYDLKYIVKNKINVFICYFSDIYSRFIRYNRYIFFEFIYFIIIQ